MNRPSVPVNYYSGPEGARVKAPPLFFLIMGPEGARVKVPPLFFVITICVLCAPNFLRGYKAQTRIETGY